MMVLLVHEDTNGNAFLKRGFTTNNINFDCINISFFTKDKSFTTKYDCIVLDISSFTPDTVEIIRKSIPETPIVVLCSEKNHVHTLLQQHSIADYILKPFEFAYFLQRLQDIIIPKTEKISTIAPRGTVRIANLHIDIPAETVRRGDTSIKLTKTEFALLRLLAEHQGQTVLRETIALYLWKSSSEEQIDKISVFINYLRKKIDADFEPKLIHTIPKKGYALSEAPLD